MLSVNEIMAQVIKEKKISQKQFEEAIRKRKESFNGLIENPDILAHFVATDYGVTIELDERAKRGEQLVKIRELLTGKYIESGKCSIRGYVLDKRDSKTKTGKPIIFVSIMDETGSIDIMIHQDAFERWSDISMRSLVELNNISIFTPTGANRSMYSFGQYSELSACDDKSFPPIDSLIKDVLNDEKPIVAMKCRATGIVYGVDYTSYNGCQVCFKKVDNCKCSDKTKMGQLDWTNIRMTNGRSTTVIAKLSPQRKIKDVEQLRGTQINVIGMFDPKRDEIMIDSYEVKQRFDKPHADFFVNKEKLKKISEDTAKFVGVWGASGVPYAALCDFLSSPRFEFSKEQARDVIERLVGDGIIKRDGINVVLVKGEAF